MGRRMFSPDIVCSEEFLDMPVSARELYFQLSMKADDDGFVQPKLIMKVTGASQDDLKILLVKRFLLTFESGVIVIKHWLIHNMIRSDRYKETRFKNEKETLFLKENKAYTEKNKVGLQNGNQVATQVRLGKVRLGKVSSMLRIETPIQKLVLFFFSLKGWNWQTLDKGNRTVFARFTRPAKQLLELCEQDIELAQNKLTIIKNWADSQEIDWSIETVFKRWFDLDILPQEKKKRAKIEGNPAYQRGNKWFVIMPNGDHKEFVGDRKDIVYA